MSHLSGGPARLARGCALVVVLAASPALAATFVVNSTRDVADASIDAACDTGSTIAGGAAECTLRAALAEANATVGADAIQFDIPATDAGCTAGGICTINVTTGAPSGVLEAVAPVTIDGSTQPGNAAVCTSAIPARPAYRIVLNGDSLEPGLRLATGSSGSTIRGLALRNFVNTLAIVDSSNNRVECNFVGTDENGTSGAAGNGANALVLGCNSTGNVIGGPDAEDGNVFSAHPYDGVQIVGGGCPPNEPDGNFVLGNFIGVARDGVSPLGNGYAGVSMYDGTGPDNNWVGVMPDGAGGDLYRGNVLSANGTGIYIDGNVSGARIAANAIGTDLAGVVDLGNLYDGIASAGTTILIGGADPAARNVIAFNGGSGVGVYDTALENRVQRNSIFANAYLGIDLDDASTPDGATPNDPGDADTGPNNLQNFPVLQSVAPNGANIDISYAVPSPGTLTVEFFVADGTGQGRTFLAEATYALAGGSAVATVPGPLAPGSRFVATATDADGNTSEFSVPFVYGAAPPAAPVPVVADPTTILLLLSLMAATAALRIGRKGRG